MGDPTAPFHLTKPEGQVWTLSEIRARVGDVRQVRGPNGTVSRRQITVARPCPTDPRAAHIAYGEPL